MDHLLVRNTQTVYLDYQASTPVDARVLLRMEEYYIASPANPHASEHSMGWRAHAAVDAASAEISSVLHTDSDEIVFTSGATEANNLAILGLLPRAPNRRRRLLVSAIEHKSVLAPALAAKRFGFTVELIPVNAAGVVDVDALEAALADDVLLVSVMAVNNEIGSIQPLRSIADLAHRRGALFHTDAVHALAAGPLDLSEIGADLASFSAHKLYGPKGAGCLVIRREVQERVEPLMYGGDQQHGLRPGTLPVPLCVGFGAAMSLMSGHEAANDRHRIAGLRDRLVRGLCAADHRARLNGPPPEARHPGNANLRFPDLDGGDILSILQPRVAASTGSACTSGDPEPSHVLRAAGISVEHARASIRFSLGRFTTAADIDQAIAFVGEAVRQCRLPDGVSISAVARA
jgi:cysteine desulfurase